MSYDFSADGLYNKFAVKLKFRHRLYGGCPKNPDLIAGWIASRTEHDDDLTKKQVAEAVEEVSAVEGNVTEEKSWVGFYIDPAGGVWVPANNVKAMLKQSASMLGIFKKKRGSKQIACEGMECKGLGADAMRIYLGKQEVDGFEERPIHVQTPMGPRSALKRVDYVDQPTIEFEIWVLKTAKAETRHIGVDELVEMLRFSQENGLGADRSQGAGKFDVVGFEVLTEEPKPKKKA